MDEFLPIHNCMRICQDNDILKEKYRKLKNAYKKLLQETQKPSRITGLFECHELESDSFLIDRSTQTDFKEEKTDKEKNPETYNNLLKRFEKEVNSNAILKTKADRLQIECEQLELKCKTLEREKLKSLEVVNSLELKIKNDLELNLKKYKEKYKKCKKQLKCFDAQFFEEIEDLKYYLQEAVKLNKHYEKILHIDSSARNGKSTNAYGDFEDDRFQRSLDVLQSYAINKNSIMEFESDTDESYG